MGVFIGVDVTYIVPLLVDLLWVLRCTVTCSCGSEPLSCKGSCILISLYSESSECFAAAAQIVLVSSRTSTSFGPWKPS